MSESFLYGAFWLFVLANLHAVYILIQDRRGKKNWIDSDLASIVTIPFLVLTLMLGFIFITGTLTKALLG